MYFFWLSPHSRAFANASPLFSTIRSHALTHLGRSPRTSHRREVARARFRATSHVRVPVAEVVVIVQPVLERRGAQRGVRELYRGGGETGAAR